VTVGDARLAELLGALSLACDVAFGFPLEKAMRTAVLAVELGRCHGLSDDALRDVYFTTLFAYAGCTAFTHEVSLLTDGDDIAISNLMISLDVGAPIDLVTQVVTKAGAGRRLAERTRSVVRMMMAGSTQGEQHARAVCDVATNLANLAGMSPDVRAALREICERWDGKGSPLGTAGDALVLPMRVVTVAHIAEIAHHRTDRRGALEVLQKRAGGQLDPALVATFAREAGGLFDAIEHESIWERFLDAEPAPRATASPARFDDVALAFGRVADLKSVFTLAHSSGVARLCDAAADALGLSNVEQRLLRRAALLHDLGRLSAPNRIWDKQGTLSRSEWEAVRMHAYWTERVLTQSAALADVSQVASAAHERLDGVGYHRAVPAALLSRSARILAAADVYHAMREPRAHRPIRDQNEAASLLLADVKACRLDREAVTAVLDVVGSGGPHARAAWPKGLTDREVQVLRLLARGRSNKQIASALRISARTAQHHVIHIYQKIERNSRAGAALFAVEHDLLDSV
jgi:HD-GYP domain-containing protein (c-di-GMP phosphodiesterase class II)